jgi:hypothetical protein
MQPTGAGGQMFVGVVTDCDDQIVVAEDPVEVCGAGTAELHIMPSGNRDGPRVHCLGGVDPGRGGWNRAALCHKAAASCERAELWVQTNTTRTAARGPPAVKPVRASARSWTYVRRASSSDRDRPVTPASCRTPR